MFVAESLELGPQCNELGIFFLEVSLLVHDPRDLLRHHLCHLVAHV